MTLPFRLVAFAALALVTAANAQPTPSVEGSKARLRAKSETVRMRGLTDLVKLGPTAATATEAVEALLKSESVEERLAATAVLIRIDPKRYDADIRAVRDALVAKDARTRSAALGAIRLLGPAAKKEYGAVIAALFAPCEGPGATRPFAAFADQTVLRAISDDAREPTKDVVPVLVSGLADSDPTARHVADCLLWRADLATAPAEPFLPLLEHKEGYARLAGARALARFARLPASALAPVAAALTDREARPYLIELLVRSAPDSAAHLPAMQKGVEDPLERAWLAARVDPVAHGEAAAKLIAARLDELRKAGQPGGGEVRRLARMAEALGPLAKSAAPALARCFGEPTREAIRAVGVGPAVVPELRAILRDPKRGDEHNAAIQCLTEFGSEAGDAVPELVAILKAGKFPAKLLRGWFDTTSEEDVLLALCAIGPAAVQPEVLTALKRRLQDGERASFVLPVSVGRLGPKAKELAPVLADLVAKAGKEGGNGIEEWIPRIGLIGIDPTHATVKGVLGRGKDKPEAPPVPALLELSVTLLNLFDGGRQKFDHATVDAIALALKNQSELQEPARKWVADCLAGKSRAGLDSPSDPLYPVCLPAALAQLNPADLPLALKTFEKALDVGDARSLAVLRRLGPAAKAVAPAVKRFLDEQPTSLACLGDPEGQPAGRSGGGCMFCAPAKPEPLGLLAPPEPFLPSQLKAPAYTSVGLRVLAAETLTAISAKK